MKNWMLVCVTERDIENPRFFETEQEAFNEMCKDIADLTGLLLGEVIEGYHNGGDIGRDTYVGERYAYSDAGVCCDWRIFNIGGDIV